MANNGDSNPTHLTIPLFQGYATEGVAADVLKDVKKKDAKALFFIQQAVAESIFPRISAATKSKEAWDALKNGYQGNAKVKTLTDAKVVKKILRSLPRKFDHVVATIEESKDLSILTVEELLKSLQSHEDRMKRYEKNSVENVFHTKLQLSKEKPSGPSGEANKKGREGHSFRGGSLGDFCKVGDGGEKRVYVATWKVATSFGKLARLRRGSVATLEVAMKCRHTLCPIVATWRGDWGK
ncbi:hypothetical protein EZV62_019568 [Acer yangbiense]|uniref:Uncharacterized protein n=1 Tax=Acer yangbiense TaxID=1000413 RepID=A0A5C7HCX4_9ROSI|nr:hypothetical protein EZV62_019568 [Acer yangbiense]